MNKRKRYVADGARESSKTDSRPPNKKSRKDVIRKRSAREDEEYNMQHPRRGAALIFNNKKFEYKAARTGSEHDVQALNRTFRKLGFETRIHIDLTHEKFFNVIKETAAEDHGDCDCLVVTVMSHGDPGYIHCYDAPYAIDNLWEPFTADRCPSLAGKPKLFFIQACRGEKKDTGVNMDMARKKVAKVQASYTLPTCADFLIAYSTVSGYASWRNTKRGSWFIQTLCEELDKHGGRRDLLSILTLVGRRIATDFQSRVPGNQGKDLKKQMPAFTSMLTRLVFFD